MTTNDDKSKKMEKPNGVRISMFAGCLLAFPAVAVAVAVGLIVHFVEKTPETCPEQNVVKCKEIAKDNSTGICHPGGMYAFERTVRLPKTIKPLHYDLELRPNMYDGDPSTFTFSGYVTITMECLKATSYVILHAKNLDITSGSVAFWANETDNGPVYESHEIDKDNERLRIHLNKNMDIHHTYVLQINFSGPLQTGDLEGLYLTSYKRENKTIYLAATQFESKYARKTFPCFDEPELKACFDVTLVRKKELSSISNMKIQRVEERGPDVVFVASVTLKALLAAYAASDADAGFEADVYGTTPIMSTYLLAFIVSDFGYINGTTEHGLQFRVWGQRESIDWLQYGLNVGMRTISHYEDYFNITFPLPKLGPRSTERSLSYISYVISETRPGESFYFTGLRRS